MKAILYMLAGVALLLLVFALDGCSTIKGLTTKTDVAIETASAADVAEAKGLAGTLDPAGAKCADAFGAAVSILTGTSCSGGPLCTLEKARILRIEQSAVNSACVGVIVP